MLKKELTPWRRVQRCYLPVPPEADEAVLDLYSRPYDARYPVICLDEQPKSLRADKRPPPPARPGHLAAYAYAYARRGPCTLCCSRSRWANGARPTLPPGARAWTGRIRGRPSRILRATARPSA